MKSKTIGGSAVASGGYGCIFRPMIPCETAMKNKDSFYANLQNSTDQSDNTVYISKLMLNKDADAEIREVLQFHKIITEIPNYEEYFIFPKVACTPKELTNDDKINYNKKCNRLNIHGISSKNVNQHIRDLSILQIPDGGIDIHDYIDNNYITKDIFYKINRNLIQLLKNAIVPMNKKHLYHLDLKASNVLINDKYKVRLIDWGMSSYIKNKQQIPNIGYRPFHFNMPYSIILMNTETVVHIEKVIYNNFSSDELTIDIASELIERYYTKYVSKKLGDGHLEYINYLSTLLNKNNNDDSNRIFNYLGKIIVHYRKKNNTFDYAYFQVFLHNIDIWGFISIYLPFMDLDNKFQDKQMQKLKKTIRKLYTEFLYKYVIEPIPLHKLITFLESLNKQYYSIPASNKIAYVDNLLSKTITLDINYFNKMLKPKSKTKKLKSPIKTSKNKSRKLKLL